MILTSDQKAISIDDLKRYGLGDDRYSLAASGYDASQLVESGKLIQLIKSGRPE